MTAIATLCVLPEGKRPWITKDQHESIKGLWSSLEWPEGNAATLPEDYRKLKQMLEGFGVRPPSTQPGIHYNAYEMIGRGYVGIDKPEDSPYDGDYTITEAEWKMLKAQFDQTNPPTHTGLYPTGQHRDLYNTLIKLGFRPPENATEVYNLARRVVAWGWDE